MHDSAIIFQATQIRVIWTNIVYIHCKPHWVYQTSSFLSKQSDWYQYLDRRFDVCAFQARNRSIASHAAESPTIALLLIVKSAWQLFNSCLLAQTNEQTSRRWYRNTAAGGHLTRALQAQSMVFSHAISFLKSQTPLYGLRRWEVYMWRAWIMSY